jgi:hypothetical protein
VPDKPLWFSRLDQIIGELDRLPWPWVDRETLESVLKVGRRRAQQILQPWVIRQIGANGVADRAELIAYLKRLATGDVAHYERRRRRRLAAALAEPRLLVEAPAAVVSQQFADLPEGVIISPGKISVTFSTPSEALQRLLALAMAIGNDPQEFERIVGSD